MLPTVPTIAEVCFLDGFREAFGVWVLDGFGDFRRWGSAVPKVSVLENCGAMNLVFDVLSKLKEYHLTEFNSICFVENNVFFWLDVHQFFNRAVCCKSGF